MDTQQIKDYTRSGGRLFYILSIDTIRDGGTKIIKCSNHDTFYINKDTYKFHLSYPTSDDNSITNLLLVDYLSEQIKEYVKRDYEKYIRNENLLNEINPSETKNMSQVKLGEIFECEGRLYSITTTDTATGNSNLEDGRSIFEFIKEVNK